MKLGAYEFEWVPDEMDIPRPEKTVAVQENFGNVGFFSWGPQLIGKEVKMKWKFCSIAQYEAFKSLYLAGGVHVLDLTPEVMVIGDPTGMEYPDPSYPGNPNTPTVSPYRRFWIGPIYSTGAFPLPDADPAYQSYDPTYRTPIQPLGVVMESGAGWIGVRVSSGAYPDWIVGDTIFADDALTSAVIVPWGVIARETYLYAQDAPKIYYSGVINYDTGGPDVLKSGDDIYVNYDNGLGYDLIDTLGSDGVGNFFTRTPYPGGSPPWELVHWTAGARGVAWDVNDQHRKNFWVMPWG